MPEGPELHLASKFVNASCNGRVFTGKVVKNPVHKSSDVDFESSAYSIAAASRGKEMQLVLTKLDSTDSKSSIKKKNDIKKCNVMESLKILFRFGMSGNFQFTTQDDIHKHAHLKFFTNDKPPMVLSYVDIRRFGRWEVGADWSKERGPDPMFEYLSFRTNVVTNLKLAAFDHPICEVMLNQKYFNGIGNYLRAEILYRLSIQPFEKARRVLEGLSEEPPDVKPMKGGKGKGKKGEEPDLLHLCHTVPLEVIAIGAGGYTADGKASDYSDFMKWLQCYYQEGMSNMVDHNKRTIWFQGTPGPMVPKEEKSRKIKSPKKRKQEKGGGDAESGGPETPAKVKKSTAKASGETKKIKQRKGKTAKGNNAEAKTTPKQQGTGRGRRTKASVDAEKTKQSNGKASKGNNAETKGTPNQQDTGRGKRASKRGKTEETAETNGPPESAKKGQRGKGKKGGKTEVVSGSVDTGKGRSKVTGKDKTGKTKAAGVRGQRSTREKQANKK